MVILLTVLYNLKAKDQEIKNLEEKLKSVEKKKEQDIEIAVNEATKKVSNEYQTRLELATGAN